MSDLRDRIAQMSPKRLALLAIELDERLRAAEARSREGIAIVGLGCRFPGAATPEAFWNLLIAGGDAVTDVPADRWDAESLFDTDPDAPGKLSSRWGGFLGDIRGFDAAFFGVSPREAVAMDPQQRLILEVCWEALEHAGISADRIHGSETGVFMGVCSADYAELLNRRDWTAIDAYLASGNAFSVLSGRVSYLLGLHGPSLSVDTACSSSLVALHLACQSLRTGECRMALAGGVNVMVTPRATIALSKAHMMAADGRCKAFDAAADGFVRGEGCGVVVLKRLTDAQADNDRILAVIRGTAVNQDGRSSGLTAPNGPSQESVIRAALGVARVEAAAVQYVEAHGTGTALGDPIEVKALSRAYGGSRDATAPLLIGSVKTNIGHLESAAGLAGLIKVVLSLEHGQIPPQLHFNVPNPHIAWSDSPVRVVTQATRWPQGPQPRIAGLSSFGFSGTNGHVIVEEVPVRRRDVGAHERPLHVCAVSARSVDALQAASRRLADSFAPDTILSDVCHTLAVGRAHMAERLAFVTDSVADAGRILAAVGRGEQPSEVQRHRVAGDAPPVAFLYSGQGSQYAGMGRELYRTEPAFRRAFDQCADLMRRGLEQPLQTIVFESSDDDRLARTSLTQPALFAVEFALTELWRSWGVRPSAVAGHSLGEIAAACTAGVVSLPDAVTLVMARARLMQAVPPGGAMVAVFADRNRVASTIAGFGDRVALAAINGPEHVVVSGDAVAVNAVRRAFEDTGVRCRALSVSHAFHSSLMAPMVDAFRLAIEPLTYAQARIDIASNVSGAMVAAGDLMDADYWARHVLAPVRFADSVQALYQRGYRVFVEVGPAPTLLGMGRRVITDEQTIWLPSLRPGRQDWRELLTSVSRLHVHGVNIDWEGFDGGLDRLKVALPTYPFERKTYWPADVPAPAPRPPSEPWRAWLFDATWDAVALSGRDSRFLESPDVVVARVTPRLRSRLLELGADVYDAIYPELDRVCAAYIVDGLRAIGCAFHPGDQLSISTARNLGVMPAHDRLFGRLCAILAEEGWIEPERDGWRVVRTPDSVDPHAAMQNLLRHYPQCRAELEFTARGGPALADVLRGLRDPLQVLFPGATTDAAEALYTHAPGLRLFNGLLTDCVVEAIAARPVGRTLRILEIGAGTGGTTAHLLPRLPAETEYFYTDVSTLFTARGRERFAEYPFVRYQTLDIERDPATQGFEPGTFDIVVGANVLHATRDLAQALAHTRQLLAPGGTLILLETTRPQRFGDLTVGYTDGWWRFADAPLRSSYALLTRGAWLSLLTASGFASADAIGGDEGQGAIAEHLALLLARTDSPMASSSSGDVLVLCGEDRALRDGLANRAERDGHDTCVVVRDTSYQAQDAGSYRVNPCVASDLASMIEAVGVRFPGRRLRIVNLWPADETVGATADDAAVAEAIRRACEPTLHLAQACASVEGGTARLFIVTRGACSTGDVPNRPALAQAPVWGLGRVIDIEHPELECTLVDLSTETDDRAVDALHAVIHGAAGDERELAWREGRLSGRRIVASAASTLVSRPATVAADGVCLITGGLSGLGLRVAEWLVGRGARALVLAGRSAPSPVAEAAIEEFRCAGVNVATVAADVSTSAGVQRMLAATGAMGGRLTGIVHAAGTTDDGGLLQQTWPRFEAVMGAKVRGAWLLHQMTAGLPLEFMVFFSTGASFLGSPGQSNHAAANMFMDALAVHRRALGLPALSINWGAWSEIGAATRGGVLERAGTRGLAPIPPASGLEVLGHLMSTGVATAAVLPMDWAEFIETSGGGRRRLLMRVAPTAVADARPPAAGFRSSGEDPVAALRLLARRPALARLREWIHRAVTDTLGLDPSESVDPVQPLSEMGMDSLMAVELRNKLGAQLSVALPATLLFNYPTLQELVDHLSEQVLSAAPAPTTATATVVTSGAGAEVFDGLSEDELAALLEGRLSDR